MGAIGSVLSAAQLAGSVIGSHQARKDDKRARELELRQLKQMQDLQSAQAQANADLDRQKIALDAANLSEERKAALKRAVARQRANFGSQGVGAGGGSSQAVLLGLFDESEEEAARRQKSDQLRMRVLDEDLSQRNSLNVLQRTQLQERNKIGNLSRNLGFGMDVLDAGKRIAKGDF